MRFRIRAALPKDKAQILDLAKHLNSVNLPHNEQAIEQILQASAAAFKKTEPDPARRQFVFAFEDLDAQRIVATSTLFAQLGRKDAPYIYLGVSTKEKYSETLDKHFYHQILSLRFSYEGPTEIGGLVVHPDYRRRPTKVGTLISYVRFLWLAMHRADFQDQILSELMPPLEQDGTSHLWQSLGHKFTGLSYREADHLSKRNKEFIKELFPTGDIHASLLPKEAQDVIGKVGPKTIGVERMLKRVGFKYANRIDPFDGGPHFLAPTDELPLVKNVCSIGSTEQISGQGLFAKVLDQSPYFEAKSNQEDGFQPTHFQPWAF